MKTTSIPKHQFEAVEFPAYEITYDRITDQLTQAFSPSELREYFHLYEKAQENPKKTRKPVEEFLQKFNKSPEVYNLLSYIYVRLKKIRKAEKLIQENYKHTPQNLFAKINYADQCLRKGKLEEVSKIFEDAEDLKTLYPERKTFHYSEVLGFYALMGFYSLKKGDRTKAVDYCTYAKMIDPEDITIKHLTKKLGKKSFLSHLIGQFQKKKKTFQ